MEHGYEQTTVARIREASGVSNGALFHRFASKEAIAAALYVESIRSFQEWHWQMLSGHPETFREAVHSIVAHHLGWVQGNVDRARFLYERGHLDWGGEQVDELTEINRHLVAAYRQWLAPYVTSGQLRELSTLLFTSIIAGPSHAIAQRWLEGDRKRPLTDYVDELAHAAWAGLATPSALAGGSPPAPAAPAPRPTRVRIQLLDEDGELLGETEATLSSE